MMKADADYKKNNHSIHHLPEIINICQGYKMPIRLYTLYSAQKRKQRSVYVQYKGD